MKSLRGEFEDDGEDLGCDLLLWAPCLGDMDSTGIFECSLEVDGMAVGVIKHYESTLAIFILINER